MASVLLYSLIVSLAREERPVTVDPFQRKLLGYDPTCKTLPQTERIIADAPLGGLLAVSVGSK